MLLAIIRRDSMVRQRIISLLLLVFVGTSATAVAGDASNDSHRAGKPVTITIGENSGIALQSELIVKERPVTRLRAITQGKLNSPITFHMKPDVRYGRVIEIMGLVMAAGYRDIKLAAPTQ